MSDGFFTAAALCIAATVGLNWLKVPLVQKRRIYWYLTLLVSVFFFISAYPNVRLGFGLVAFAFFAMTLSAFLYTPYIRVNGSTYALRAEDANADAIGNPEMSTARCRRLSLQEWWATPRGCGGLPQDYGLHSISRR